MNPGFTCHPSPPQPIVPWAGQETRGGSHFGMSTASDRRRPSERRRQSKRRSGLDRRRRQRRQEFIPVVTERRVVAERRLGEERRRRPERRGWGERRGVGDWIGWWAGAAARPAPAKT